MTLVDEFDGRPHAEQPKIPEEIATGASPNHPARNVSIGAVHLENPGRSVWRVKRSVAHTPKPDLPNPFGREGVKLLLEPGLGLITRQVARMLYEDHQPRHVDSVGKPS